MLSLVKELDIMKYPCSFVSQYFVGNTSDSSTKVIWIGLSQVGATWKWVDNSTMIFKWVITLFNWLSPTNDSHSIMSHRNTTTNAYLLFQTLGNWRTQWRNKCKLCWDTRIIVEWSWLLWKSQMDLWEKDFNMSC